jgi:hypothetical protein
MPSSAFSNLNREAQDESQRGFNDIFRWIQKCHSSFKGRNLEKFGLASKRSVSLWNPTLKIAEQTPVKQFVTAVP